MAPFSPTITMGIPPYSEPAVSTTASTSVYSLRTVDPPPPTVIAVPTTVSGTLEILTSHAYTTFPGPATNPLPTLTATLSMQTSSQKQNTSTSPSSPQTPPATSSFKGSDSAVIEGSSAGAAALLCSIVIIAFFFRLRSYRRKFNVYPLEHTRPIVTPVDRNSNAGI
ncbi:hypothetical protein EDD16DRAFT_1706201 [Pisolithus croceorrhizus]|nr:hypothetical protein EDD16DRAFT_1706201 [Pisolithus croceorrhizus]